MRLERVLLLFEENRPFWTERLVEMAGEDPLLLDKLAEKGLLKKTGGGFCLSDDGRCRFREWAAESWLEALPAGDPEDPLLEGLKVETALLFERGFKGFHGTKKVFVSPELEFFPDMMPTDLFSISGDHVQWRFKENPGVSGLVKAFPRDREQGSESLKELEEDIKKLKPSRKKGDS